MKNYKAVIRNATKNDAPIIVEQPRLFLGVDFVKAALAWAFEESCMGGIDAKHIVVTITADEKPVCEYLLFSKMECSRVYANLYIKRQGKKTQFVRRMIIAE